MKHSSNLQTRSLLAMLFLFTLCISCEKDTDNNLTCKTSKTTEKIYFDGISATDANGSPLSSPDTEDWNTSATWTTQETELFSQDQLPCPTQATQKIYPAYPNPTQGDFAFLVENAAVSDLQLRFVDENFQVIATYEYSQLAAGPNILNFDFQDRNLNDTIRLYYKVIQADCAFKGQGDILLTQ
ncbi:MAG: hypothetical protein AB8G15_02990 [Saprospiraceae bacterium]